MTDEWSDCLVRVTAQLPERDVAALAAALDGGYAGLERHRVHASSPAIRNACDTVRAAVNATSALFAAGVLLGALQARKMRASTLDVVWTGPPSKVTTSRLTSAAIVELVDAAESEILLLSYAMHSEPMLSRALSRADDRGVSITLLAERGGDNPNFHGPSTAFTHVSARRLRWPADRRPTGASLHAKVLVVDRTIALVGSANVTGSAMERNLECSVLLRDAVAASDIVRHIDQLIATGILTVSGPFVQ